MDQPQPQIQIHDDGLNRHTIILLATASATVIVAVALAIAIARISAGLIWAAIIAATGSATQQVLVGIGLMRRHTLLGHAELQQARGRATAARIQAQAINHLPPTTPP